MVCRHQRYILKTGLAVLFLNVDIYKVPEIIAFASNTWLKKLDFRLNKGMHSFSIYFWGFDKHASTCPSTQTGAKWKTNRKRYMWILIIFLPLMNMENFCLDF